MLNVFKYRNNIQYTIYLLICSIILLKQFLNGQFGGINVLFQNKDHVLHRLTDLRYIEMNSKLYQKLNGNRNVNRVGSKGDCQQLDNS